MRHIFLTLTLALLTGISTLSLYAGTLAVSGTLSKEVTSTVATAAIEVRDCDGNLLSTIPSENVETKKYEPYAKSGQTVRFEVTRLENPEVAIVTIDTNINIFSYNATDGQFSINLIRDVIIESRYNYKVKARISENSYASVIFEREYALAPAGSGSAFPIGSVIAYLGNGGNIAAMEANGWFKCAGQSIDGLTALSADEKTALKNVLGNSSNLPDLRGNFLRGLDESRGWDDDAATRTGGESGNGVRSYQGNQIQSHNHTGSTSTNGNHNHGGSTGDAGWSRSTDDGGTTGTAAENSGTHSHSISWDGDHSHTVTINNAGGAETRPENIAVYWLIRGR
ncbi:MAG: hypothetical protein ACKOX1_08875 [Ignavibacteria bacterium]